MLKGNGPCNAQRMEHRRRGARGGRLGAGGRRRAYAAQAAPQRRGRRHGGGGMTADGRRDRDARRTGRCGRCSSAPRRGLSHRTSAACTRRTPTMALRNARDLYTRRGEGVSIWVVPVRRDHRVQPGREGPVLRPGRGQGLPAPDVLRHPRGGAAPVTAPTPTATRDVDRDRARRLRARLGDDALVLAHRLGGVDRHAPRSSRRTSRWPTSRSTCSGRPARCSLRR